MRASKEESKEEMTGPALGSTFAAALHDGLARYGSLRSWRETTAAPAPPVALAAPVAPVAHAAPAASVPDAVSVAAMLEEALPPSALAAVAGVLLESTARQMLGEPETVGGDEALRALGIAQVLGYATAREAREEAREAAGAGSVPPAAVSAALRTVKQSLEVAVAVGGATGAGRA
ncbi:hypothetical protein FGW37_16175 [Streptomyces rectiverticillatus]|uniref:hypothetical protein n=1 Tax=Streptomyces rectiverticillatus TaxID=173860 RepID=UPI0015C2E4DF|nr:hypothetical protein [Streptomyces rectiverticillatus]QLE72926.1 hypothetical protein FGW37_16175 [Streptomyces rectiverticillatus]